MGAPFERAVAAVLILAFAVCGTELVANAQEGPTQDDPESTKPDPESDPYAAVDTLDPSEWPTDDASASQVPGAGAAEGDAYFSPSGPADFPQESEWPMPPAMPSSYVQSAMCAGDPATILEDASGCYWSGTFFTDTQRAKTYFEALSASFGGAEVIGTRFETANARNNLRILASAAREYALVHPQPFELYLVLSRLPGFFFREDLQNQPPGWRAQSLGSDGRARVRYPSDQLSGQSLIAFCGHDLDIANENAVSAALANLRNVFRAECQPQSDCVGPWHGYVIYNEAQLSSLYTPFDEDPEHADLLPVTAGAPSCLNATDKVACYRQRYPKVHAGVSGGRHAVDMYVDADAYFSFWQGPRRQMPLYSWSAKNSFVAYAHARNIYSLGGVTVNKLPARRSEFNYASSTVVLPSWVKFVSPSNTAYWQLWENWAYDTWTSFASRVAQVINEGQAGNPDFRGVLYFQNPMWYSIRGAPANQAFSYRYLDADGGIHAETTTLRSYSGYNSLNPVVSAVDLTALMSTGQFSAFVHETAESSIGPGYPGGGTPEQFERNVFSHPQYRYLFMAKGAMTRHLVRDSYHRAFGTFVRSRNFGGLGPLSPERFSGDWDRVVELLQPDIVSTLPPQAFVYDDRFPLLQLDGRLQDIWNERLAQYRDVYQTCGDGVCEAHEGNRRCPQDCPVTVERLGVVDANGRGVCWNGMDDDGDGTEDFTGGAGGVPEGADCAFPFTAIHAPATQAPLAHYVVTCDSPYGWETHLGPVLISGGGSQGPLRFDATARYFSEVTAPETCAVEQVVRCGSDVAGVAFNGQPEAHVTIACP